MYPSNITFLYYEDYAYGCDFIHSTLELELIMKQDFAQFFQLSQTSYVGVVKSSGITANPGSTLISINVDDLDSAYQRMKDKSVYALTPIETIESIPLKSFFFQDKEGHRFEFQHFLKEEDLIQFNHEKK